MRSERFAVACLVLLWSAPALATQARLVKDIYPGADPLAASDPTDFVQLGDLLLFTADDDIHGRELWRTDGSEAGTVLVADLVPGRSPSYPGRLTRFGSIVLFRAGEALWRTDGSAEGTKLVKRVDPYDSYGVFVPYRGVLLFSGYDEEGGAELWRTDGTTEGTWRIADIHPGEESSYPFALIVVNDIVYFTAEDGTHGCELWRTDGTPGGTWLVKDTNPSPDCVESVGPYGMFQRYLAPNSLTDVNGALFFTTPDGLWKSDGSENGTTQIASFYGCSGFEVVSCPASCLTNVGGTLYFQAETYGSGGAGREPWRSDGTPEGTIMLADINPRDCYVDGTGFDRCSSNPCGFRQVGDEVQFTARMEDYVYRLWRTDGTVAGTRLVGEVPPTPTPSLPPRVRGAIEFGGSYVFPDGELYISDGSESGTRLLKEINVRPASSSPSALTGLDGNLYFFARGPGGRQLWRSDGTEEGTTALSSLAPQTDYATLRSLTPFGSGLLFVADDGMHGIELWRSDGTSARTGLVRDIAPGNAPGLPFDFNLRQNPELIASGNAAYFVGGDAYGLDLWCSDGTFQGTRRIEEPRAAGDGIPHGLTDVDGTLFFAASHSGPPYGSTLWRTDGTASGTRQLIAPDTGNSPQPLIEFEGALVFSLYDEVGAALWMVSPTSATPTKVKGGFRLGPSGLTLFRGALYFTASEGTNDLQLWRSDGTEAGTAAVADLHVPPVQGGFLSRAVVDDRLFFFTFYTPEVGDELWVSDGTAAGTRMVADINPGPEIALPRSFVAVRDTLLFLADDGGGRTKLYRSDGTEAGTTPIALDPPLRPAEWTGATAVGETLYIVASDDEVGTELWAVPLDEVTSRPPYTPTPTPTACPRLEGCGHGETPVATACTVDCDDSGTVSSADLATLVEIGLGRAALPSCGGGDRGGDDNITVDEIITAWQEIGRVCH